MKEIINARKLTRRFGERTVFENLSFSLPSQSFLSIFGSNGAGKTTLLRILATLSKPTEGELFIAGINAKEHPEKVRGQVGLVSHKSMLYGDLTALENLEFYASLYGVTNPTLRAKELLELVGLTHRRYDPVKTFSRGMTQRVSIARSLVHNPQLLLLDEPYSGLDAKASSILDEIILSQKTERTIVMVSHDFEKSIDMSTHCLLLSQGSIGYFGEIEGYNKAELKSSYSEIIGQGVR